MSPTLNFDALDFSRFGEADVREEIVAPLLRHLGYKAGTDNDIIREQSLRYPRVSIGRKNEKRDPLLRGTADYICDVNKIVRWVIEAKSPDVILGIDEIEQSYSYANHPEVRAVYFCITNGRELRIYQTNHGPEATPLLNIPYENLQQSLQEIENLLGPKALLRDHPRQEMDIGKPIGPGLRSVVRITGGRITILKSTLDLPQVKGLNYSILGGAVERDDRHHLIAFLRTLSPFDSLQKLNERLGIAVYETMSEDEVLSTDPNVPTIFRSSEQVQLPRGEKILDLTTWQESALPYNVTMKVETKASGILHEQTFQGNFAVIFHYLEFQFTAHMTGDFEVHIA